METRLGKQNKLQEICPTVNLALTRKDSWQLTRLLIGHTRLPTASTIQERTLECEVTISVEHILAECGNFALERLQHYDPREGSLKDLLTNVELVLEVLQFLRDID